MCCAFSDETPRSHRTGRAVWLHHCGQENHPSHRHHSRTTLKVTGQVTKTAVNTTLDVASSAFKKGAVTVIDTGTGVSRKVPWEEGLRVSKLNTTGRAVEIVRGARKIKATTTTVLRAGDVVRLN